jgi:hypothetical protein
MKAENEAEANVIKSVLAKHAVKGGASIYMFI